MKYIDITTTQNELLPFYLAAEEYVAKYVEEDECFFMWQVDPTVIFGRNQLIENEVNLEFCKSHGIRTFRRKSGGGCVYADRSNIMFSYINSSDSVQFTFDRYIRMVAFLLQKLGLDAHASNRNDVLIGNRKVSGNAFYHIPGRNIVHGTMLYDTNMENMVGSITPSNEKLVSKGVESVRQHITLLKDYLTIGIEEFKQFIRDNLCDSTLLLTEKDVQKIREIEQEYYTPEFIYGNNPRYTIKNKVRIDGCGHFEISIEVKNNVIKKINLMGDYFLCGDLDKGLLQRLTNVEYSREAIEKALEGVNTEEYILHLTKDALIDMIITKTL